MKTPKTLLTTVGKGNMKDAIISVFGIQQSISLSEFNYKSERLSYV